MGCLYDIPFTYKLALDEDRARDGIQMRYEYDFQFGRNDISVAEELYGVPCSVLEMLVALAGRCYDEFLCGFPEDEVNNFVIFWDMITTLGLKKYDNNHFIFDEVHEKICNFCEKNYEKNGLGGIFYIKSSNFDARKVEIWWQMQRYLNEKWF